MSSRSVKAAHSAGRMIAVQLIIGVGQILYSAVTARVFAPSEFGAFAAVLSLQGLVTLVATTGLPSYALKERNLGRYQLRALTILALIGAVTSVLVFLLLSRVWLRILNADDGLVFVPLMAVTVFISPFAAVESALFRRELRSKLDRRILVLAFFLSSGSGLAMIEMTHELWALAWSTMFNPVIVLVLSRFHRRDVPVGDTQSSLKLILYFSTRVTFQNLVFYIIYQMPNWVIGTSLGPASMGNFSRATTLTSLPSGAMSSGLSRVLQPMWRHVDGSAAHLRAAAEATLLSALFAFPIFGILAATSSELSRLWLGPGWEIAYMLTPLLAVAYGLQVPYVALAGSCEMKGRFGPGRISQSGMLLSLVLFLGVMVVFGSVVWAGVALIASQLFGLFILSWVAAKPFPSIRRKLIRGIAGQIISGVAVGSIAWGTVRYIEYLGGVSTSITILAIFLGGLAGVMVFLIMIRWNSAVPIVRRRGISVPKWFEYVWQPR